MPSGFCTRQLREIWQQLSTQERKSVNTSVTCRATTNLSPGISTKCPTTPAGESYLAPKRHFFKESSRIALTKLGPQKRSTLHPRHIRKKKKPPDTSSRQPSAQASQHPQPTTKHGQMCQQRPWDPCDTSDPSSYSDSDSDDYCAAVVHPTHQDNPKSERPSTRRDTTNPTPTMTSSNPCDNEARPPDSTSAMVKESTTFRKKPLPKRCKRNKPRHSRTCPSTSDKKRRSTKPKTPKPTSEPATPVQTMTLKEYFCAKLLLTTPRLAAERRSHRKYRRRARHEDDLIP
jgi:hypothetical protein